MFKEKYRQIRGLAESAHRAGEKLAMVHEDQKPVLKEAVAEAICATNRELFGFDHIEAGDSETPEGIKTWFMAVSSALDRREKSANRFDEEFALIMDLAKLVSREALLDRCRDLFFLKPAREQEATCLYYQTYSHFWGTLIPEQDNYETMELRIDELKEHAEEFEWLYGQLGDYRSKQVLIQFLLYWLSYSLDCIEVMREHCFDDYFDPDLLSVGEDEVVVDLGGFNGDTVKLYVDMYGQYKRIYTFEVSPRNVEEIRKRTAEYPDIVIVQKAAGSARGTMRMAIDEQVSSDNTILSEAPDGREFMEVETVTVDEEVTEPVTLIKMDIEGAEKDALRGCARHIREEHPKLLICVYHGNEDIWRIPRLIREMDGSYRFYLRSNGNQWGPAEIVLFAL